MTDLKTNFTELKDLVETLDLHLMSLERGVKVAAPRARKSLMEIAKLTKLMRGDITTQVKAIPKKQKNKSDLTASITAEATSSE